MAIWDLEEKAKFVTKIAVNKSGILPLKVNSKCQNLFLLLMQFKASQGKIAIWVLDTQIMGTQITILQIKILFFSSFLLHCILNGDSTFGKPQHILGHLILGHCIWDHGILGNQNFIFKIHIFPLSMVPF